MNHSAPLVRCLPALRLCIREYASRPRPRLGNTLSLEHVSRSHSSRNEDEFSNLPSLLSFSKEPEFWPCTAPSCGRPAGFRTRPRVPRREGWPAPSLRETAMSLTLFVFLLVRFLNFACVPFATDTGLSHSQGPHSLSALDRQDRMGKYGEVY
ncbi:hypothetical protein NCU17224 [Neurospora crassa OR74A]|uniref:Uncharacterized protein n=1 Tax=Neurospora crassa (strain ATCC 24698 / 74-OR23-1A / CBS 708.71 / DSM 1257 / FGSC 987) TaxID=367110 RepID=V5IKJ6_NEUCR|nr:hypothetical protein NCU17224 [Neurospora crassa OR74A]ESA41927.1 hypothetical protein NCU17224 [Neurospora crassa OR74A]|eukprot:XP_011395366.1 hypothetical protein NCU17224 [Neurospora crassa OR74A]